MPLQRWWHPEPIRREYANCCHTLKEGGAHSHKMVVPSPLSPARVAGMWPGGGPGHSVHPPPMSPSPFSPPAAQSQPKVQASLGWRLPSHLRLPETQVSRAG